MAKQKKQNKAPQQSSIPEKEVKNKSVTPSFPEYAFVMGATIIYAIAVFFGIYHHEPWRDEIHAWTISRDSKSIADLFQNLRTDGHPALWHLLLYTLNLFTHDPFSMQLLDGVFIVIAMFLFFNYAPFSRLQKILFAFGYFTLFEYALIARNYTPGILMMILFMALYKNKARNAIYLGIVLLLMASTNLQALIVAIALFAVWCMDSLFGKEKKTTLLYGGIALGVIGILLSIWQLRPDPHTRNYLMWAEGFDMTRVRFAVADMVRAFIPLPVFAAHTFWNSNLLIKDQVNISSGIFFASVTMWLVFSFFFLRKRNAFLLFVIGSAGIISLTYLVYLPYIRYLGHLYIIFFMACWFSEMKSDEGSYKKFIPSLFLSLSNGIYKIRFVLLFPLLLTQSVAGIFAWYSDVKNVFSQNKNVGEYLTKEKLSKYEMIGFSDMMTEGITGWLNKPFYYAERGEYGTFIKWDDGRKHGWPIQYVIDEAFKQTRNKKEPVIFVSNSELNANGVPVSQTVFIDSVEMKLLNKFAPSIIPEESFYIYKMTRIK